MDPKLDRQSRTLIINGFWLEKDIQVDKQFASAFIRGLIWFMDFLEAESIDTAGVSHLNSTSLFRNNSDTLSCKTKHKGCFMAKTPLPPRVR
jgi:hypothetical protein